MLKFLRSSEGKLDKAYQALVFIIGFGLIIHTPLAVWLSSMWPSYDIYFKSWKEILIVIAFLMAAAIFYKKKRPLPYPKLIGLIAGYKILHIFVAIMLFQGLLVTVAGLMIDLRYLAYFLLVLFAAYLYKDFAKSYLKLMFAGGAVVAIFALLQVYILPADFLSFIGYGKNTIMPYLTVDQNPDFVRINSTLRGPNPLGAYLTVLITILGVWLYINYKKLNTKMSWLMAIVMVGALVGLWYSYSRSAILAMIADLVVVLLFIFKNKLTTKRITIFFAAVILIAAGLYAARSSYFVSSVLLHENIYDTNQINSNEGHASSLNIGLERLVELPLGAGVGSTGSASLYGNSPYIVESQYLFVAHEVGWLGLGLFIAIQIYVLYLLFKKRDNWLAMSVFASGIGLVIIGFLLPVWADDTVSILWWGMAGLALGAKKL